METLNKEILRLIVLIVGLWVALPALSMGEPIALVKSTSDQMLEQIASRGDELKADSGKIYKLVEHIVLPRFDFERMSRLALGKYWRRAKEDEKTAFVGAFRELLVRTYAIALLSYSGEEIIYLPSHNAKGATDVKVNTKVSVSGAASVPISYSLYMTGDDWKVYDVSIDGISLVSNYRSSFASQIKRYKLSGLIKKLEKRNQRRK